MNNGRWKQEEHEYLLQYAGKKTLEELSTHLGKSELAIKLYLHRRKISTRTTAKRNLVQEILKMKFLHPEDFSPSRRFYNEVNINQMRWWDLYHGRKTLTQNEYMSLAKYFGITLEDAMNCRQLNLFEEKDNG